MPKEMTISDLEARIIVTDYADRPFLLPPELEPAFNTWNENEFNELDLDPDRFAEYRIAGEEEGEGLPLPDPSPIIRIEDLISKRRTLNKVRPKP